MQYDWSRSSSIPSLAAILAQREEIFTKQRAFNDRALRRGLRALAARRHRLTRPPHPSAELQRKSQDLIATKLATYARSGNFSTFGYKVSAYCSFSRAVNIPPWPVTPPVVALFVHQNSYYATSSRGVLVTAFNMVHKVCRELWETVPGFRELLEWPGAQGAVVEWKRGSRASPDSRRGRPVLH